MFRNASLEGVRGSVPGPPTWREETWILCWGVKSVGEN